MFNKVIGSVMVLAGIVLIVGISVETINLTEGQAFIQHWEGWLLAIMLVGCGGYVTTVNNG